MGRFGKIWEDLGRFGKVWEDFPKFQKKMVPSPPALAELEFDFLASANA